MRGGGGGRERERSPALKGRAAETWRWVAGDGSCRNRQGGGWPVVGRAETDRAVMGRAEIDRAVGGR